MSAKPVRVRLAPSPTGDPHVGSAYQALYNYCFAKRHGGQFILRIEDTDQARSRHTSEAMILEALRWLGLQWDEGPDVGGPYGPYRQSERLDIYRTHVRHLLDAGHAYYCFCTPERLAEMRAAQQKAGRPPGYDRRCRDVASADAQRRVDSGEGHVVRMKVPVTGSAVIQDLLRGTIHKDWASVDDQVILKSDGFPTYHLACVVDDRLMQITHVIRGEEWINSVPKHLQLYAYFGWEPPVFCHLPLLRNNDGNKTKLSKRKNPTSINFYRRAGFLPQALVNFLGLMGWSMPDGRDKFTLQEMIDQFRLEDVTLGGPVFDPEKLRWLNGRYMREDYTPPALLEELKAWALNDRHLEGIVALAQPRMQTLGDWGHLTAFFFADDVHLDPAALTMSGQSPDALKTIFQMAIWEMEKLDSFGRDELSALFTRLAEVFAVKLRELTRPFYVAVSGSGASTPLFDSMAILGSDMVRVRLRRALHALGGLSEKQLKAVEKDYIAKFGAALE